MDLPKNISGHAPDVIFEQPLTWTRFPSQKSSNLIWYSLNWNLTTAWATQFHTKKITSIQFTRQKKNIEHHHGNKFGNLQYFIPYSIIFGFMTRFTFLFRKYNNENYFWAMQWKKNWKFLLPAQNRLADNKKSSEIFYLFEFEWENIITSFFCLKCHVE